MFIEGRIAKSIKETYTFSKNCLRTVTFGLYSTEKNNITKMTSDKNNCRSLFVSKVNGAASINILLEKRTEPKFIWKSNSSVIMVST